MLKKEKHSRKLTSRKVLLQLKERKGFIARQIMSAAAAGGRGGERCSGNVLFSCLLFHLIVRLTYFRMIIVTFPSLLNKNLCAVRH